MYNQITPDAGSIICNESTEGETIEDKIRRVTENGEPITDGAPLIYTERKDGVDPATNIRTDRFDVAVDAMGQISKSTLTKRQQAIQEMQAKKGGETGNETTPIESK